MTVETRMIDTANSATPQIDIEPMAQIPFFDSIRGKIYTVVEMPRTCHENFDTTVTQFLGGVVAPKDFPFAHDEMPANGNFFKPYVLTFTSKNQQDHFLAYIGKESYDSTHVYCKMNHIPITNDTIYLNKAGLSLLIKDDYDDVEGVA